MKFYNRISEICRNHKKVALFVDMDGTIVEYRVFPENFVTTETKEVFLNAEPLEVVLKNLEKINEKNEKKNISRAEEELIIDNRITCIISELSMINKDSVRYKELEKQYNELIKIRHKYN